MSELRYTGQYKKDLKKYLNNPQKLEELRIVLDYLRNDVPLPKKYKDHVLKRNYQGCHECHIEGDFLLIRYNEDKSVIALYRLGTHSELFNK